MYHKLRYLTALSLAVFTPAAFALTVPSDGSDGALNITGDTVIDLSQAVTGSWTNNNAANAGKGIYDPEKWAIVFKYSSVNIPAQFFTNGTLIGNKITFINHPSHAPVVWIVQGNVTIDGIVSLDAQPGTREIPQAYTPPEPGPGGFRGGAFSPLGMGAGYGWAGGGFYPFPTGNGGYNGLYGNPQIVPLIGGSGAAAYNHYDVLNSGGAGGGAILIVAGGTVVVNGSISVKGWGRFFYPYRVSSASGAVKIIANRIEGVGTIDASGPNPAGDNPAQGTEGRTRMETTYLAPTLNIFPNAVAVAPGATPTLWPATNAPTVRVHSVVTANSTNSAPLDPYAAVAGTSDIAIQSNDAAIIYLETQNLPIQGTVSLRITPKYGNYTQVNATYVSGNILQALWQVTATLPQGYCTLQARATSP